MNDLLDIALDAASQDADYADARAVVAESESLTVRDQVLEGLDRSESMGVGVRVLVDGVWGFAASALCTKSELQRIGRTAVEIARAGKPLMRRAVDLVSEPKHVDTWSTPIRTDPFSVPIESKLETLCSATHEMRRVKKTKVARGTMDLLRQRVWFASSEGALIDQEIVQSGAGIEATAVDGDNVQMRSYPGSFRGHSASGGYEVIDEMDLPGSALQTAEEAVALLSAPECPATTTTLVLDGHQVMLQVHESVGHPTELDRVLGLEAGFAGTSFVSLEDLGRLRYGSDQVTITADATAPGGLGTYGYDDEGVAAQRVPLIQDGVLVGFQTSRETAPAIGEQRSNGTMRAEGWENFPLIRMTNVNLMPRAGTLDDLIADVDDGIYMATNKSWSIDDKRKNFQFGCEIGWEIRKGKLTRMLRNPRYTGMTLDFWRSCDAVAGDDEWKMWGTPNCGKGQPGQTMRVGHGTAPARFRNVKTGYSQ